MKRESAARRHEVVNMAFWCGNPDWTTGNKAADAALSATRPLWRAAHWGMLKAFFNTDEVLAVNGETVVARRDGLYVDKYMFRYPRDLSIEEFYSIVRKDVRLVTTRLAGVALETRVSIRPAHVFRDPNDSVHAVTQTQLELDLDTHPALNLELVQDKPAGSDKDRTARDLEFLIKGAADLIADHGRYPDIARSGGNLRRSQIDGSVTLIDVMPFYSNGSRAIGDHPNAAIQSVQDNLARFEQFVGEYGA